MLLYFREFFFFILFQTFTIFFIFKSVLLGFSNITGYPTGCSFQDRPIAGRGTLYYPVVLCSSGSWHACYSKAPGLHGDQPHSTIFNIFRFLRPFRHFRHFSTSSTFSKFLKFSTFFEIFNLQRAVNRQPSYRAGDLLNR